MAHIHEKIDYIVNGFIIHNDKVLFVMHKKLQMWLMPGGHVELDEDPEEALYREIEEETGIMRPHLMIIHPHDSLFTELNSKEYKSLPSPHYLDIHTITPTHQHIGMNYIFTSDTQHVQIDPNESDDYRWMSAEEIGAKDLKIKENVRLYANKALALAK